MPARPVTSGAAQSALTTASSAASTAAAKSPFSPPSAKAASRAAPRPTRPVVANATKISPDPWCATDPVRASPSPARRASRCSWAPCERRVGGHAPRCSSRPRATAARPGRPGAGRRGRRRSAGSAPSRSSPARARRRSPPPRARRGSRCRSPPSSRSRPCPVPAPTAPSATAPPDAAASARPASAASTWTGAAVLSQLSSHSPTTGMTTSSSPTAGSSATACGDRAVVDPPDGHRRRQVDRRLDRPPLRQRDVAGELAGAVEHRAAGRHRPAEQVRAGRDRRHPGARHLRRVAPDGDVADPHAGDVGDRVRRPGLERADPQPELAQPGAAGFGRTGHARKTTAVGSPTDDGRDPARVERRAPAARADGGDLARRPDPGGRAARARRRDPRGARGRRPSGGRGDRARRRARSRRSTTPRCSPSSPARTRTGTRPGCPTTPASPRSCRTSSPTPRCSGRSSPPSRSRRGRGPATSRSTR